MRSQPLFLALTLLVSPLLSPCAPAQVDPLNRSVLFIRGADGSGGLGNGTIAQRTAHLSDVFDASTAVGNHGFGSLRQLLEGDGFQVSQLIESPQPLSLAVLQRHRVVVFGSNNKTYTPAEVQAFHAYMDAGGSALFISDANWGPVWGAAPASDNPFLARYGIEVYQDSGFRPSMRRADPGRYVDPGHPVLSGPGGADVDSYTGEGISLFRIGPGAGGYQNHAVVAASGLLVRLNTPGGQQGQRVAAGANDAALVVAERGDSRLVGHFDRNTFFNANGAGADLTQEDNAQLALNIFRYLASVPATARTAGVGCGLGGPVQLGATPPVLGATLRIDLANASPLAAGLLVAVAGGPFAQPLPGGCTLQLPPAPLIAIVAFQSDGAGGWQLNLPLPVLHVHSGSRFTFQALVLAPAGPFPGGGELSNGLELRLGYPR